jgi:signal transduction histidine kinase
LIFDKLKNVSKNLGETMNELMDTLKAKTHPDVDLTEIRFKEVLDKVVQSLEGELIVAQASVTFDFNDAPSIPYSKPYLESIFQNLLTNSIKYKSPDRKPAIHFRSQLTDNHLELQVTDNGQGIDMEQFGDKLFGLHKTFHKHQEARGVGLFLVKTQIEALGGKITVTSEVDKGTTFVIRFN